MASTRSLAITALTVGMLAGPVAGVSAQVDDVPGPPVEVDGHIDCGPPVGDDGWGHDEQVELETAMVLTRYRGGTWQPTASMSDARLEGDWYHTWESDTYASADAETGLSVAAATWRVENGAGAWEGGQMELTMADGITVQTLALLAGEDAYAGLTALLHMGLDEEAGCGIDVRGVIVEGMPALEPYRPE